MPSVNEEDDGADDADGSKMFDRFFEDFKTVAALKLEAWHTIVLYEEAASLSTLMVFNLEPNPIWNLIEFSLSKFC